LVIPPHGVFLDAFLLEDAPVNGLSPLTGESSIDALDVEQQGGFRDTVARFGPSFPVYFSLAPGSPTLTALGADPADILQSDSLGIVVVRTAASLGLQPGDDIDALAVTGGDLPSGYWFSLTASSPTLAVIGASAADVLTPSTLNPYVVISAFDFYLLATDDLDALTSLDPQSDCSFDVAATLVSFNATVSPNFDTLTATPAIVGQPWTATVTKQAAGAAASFVLILRSKRNLPNGAKPLAPVPVTAGRVLTSGTPLINFTGSHNGTTGSVTTSIPIDCALLNLHFVVQARTSGGPGGLKLSNGLDGTIGLF
jgi:hypothetical protein